MKTTGSAIERQTMSRSRKTKMKGPTSKEDGPVFFDHPLNAVDKDVLREFFSDLGKKKTGDFPALINKMTTLLSHIDPIGILATTSSYALQVGVSRSGIQKRIGSLAKINQHHIEIIQAFALSLPRARWGTKAPLPRDIQDAFDLSEEVSNAFFQRRYPEEIDLSDKLGNEIRSLQEGLRLHTQIVRNWGYFSHVVRIIRDLYSNFDDYAKNNIGLTIVEIVELMVLIIREVEKRSSDRRRLLHRVLRERNPKKMMRAYNKINPHFTGSADETIRALSHLIHDRRHVASFILSHWDLTLPNAFTFKLDDLVRMSGLEKASIVNVAQKLSVVPGALAEHNLEFFFLDNPVWSRPLIALSETEIFVPLPQMFFSFAHKAIEQLLGEAKSDEIARRRAEFLEQEVAKRFSAALPDAKHARNFKWCDGDRTFETDLIIEYDVHVFIVEAKSGAISSSALRGAPERAKRHIQELVLHPSVQSERLQQIIWQAKEGDEAARVLIGGLGLNLERLKEVIRVSCTLYDLTPFLNFERQFQEIGWVPKDHSVAVTLNIADLGCVLDILPDFHLPNYFSERNRLQSKLAIFGDELDWLGLYLGTGFNFSSLEEDGTHIAISGMSEKVDRYYNGIDAGLPESKPQPRLAPLWAAALKHLASRRFPGWTKAAVNLLQAASFDEQKDVEAGFWKICGSLNNKKVWMKENHTCCIIVTPPPAKNTIVAFYAFPPELKTKRHEVAQNIASEAFRSSDSQYCLLFGHEVIDGAPKVVFVALFPRSPASSIRDPRA